MKKIILPILAVILLLSFSACTNTYKGPFSGVTYNKAEGVVVFIDFREEVHKKILSQLNKGEWAEAVPECPQEYEFKVDDDAISYHSECGTFYNITKGLSMQLSETEKTAMNQLLGAE